ncbi:MAG: PIN domain nuclease [Acidimicrobiia bacterium]|nr:PIN domain nuclease [Acidimicrobiia bacterium]
MMLVDTSAWVEFDRATGSVVDKTLTGLIRDGGRNVVVTEPVLMEVLAGATTAGRRQDLRRLLTSFEWQPVDPVADFEGAAKVYRSCREAGVTPRGLIDCMIASIAMRVGLKLLTADQDFSAMSRVLPLKVFTI